MYIPDWIYRLLPYAYVVSGAFAMIALRTTLGFVCGAILISAGAIIWKMRRDYARAVEIVNRGGTLARRGA